MILKCLEQIFNNFIFDHVIINYNPIMGSAAGGGQGGGAAAPQILGKMWIFFDFCNDKSDFLSIPPPPAPPDFRVQRTPCPPPIGISPHHGRS